MRPTACREVAVTIFVCALISSSALAGVLASRQVHLVPGLQALEPANGSQQAGPRISLAGESQSQGDPKELATTMGQGIQVADTLVMLNNTLIPGNFVSTNGLEPEAVAFDSWNGYLYVTDSGSDNVSIVDGATNRFIGNIPVASLPDAIAFDSANGELYAACWVSGTVSVINGTRNRVIASITVGYWSAAVAFDPANGDVYVGNSLDGNVSVIDGAKNQVVATVQLGPGYASSGTAFEYNRIGGIAFDASNQNVYVANGLSNISIISGTTNTVLSTIHVGSEPAGVAYDDSNGDIYIANYLSNNISVIDSATNQIIAWIPAGSAPNAVAFDTLNRDLYVVNDGPNSYGGGSYNVTVIDGAGNKVVDWISAGTGLRGIAFDGLNGALYITSATGSYPPYVDNLVAIDGTSNSVVATIPLVVLPLRVAFDSLNGDVYVTNAASDNLSVINGTTDRVMAWIPIGFALGGIAVDTLNGNLYVADANANNVTVINGATNAVIGRIPVGTWPGDVAFDGLNGDLYVANVGSDNVTVIDGATNEPIASISVGSMLYRGPVAITFDSANGNLYAAHWDSGIGSVSVIDGGTNRVVANLSVGWFPSAVAYDSSNDYVYVSNSGLDSNNVTVIDARTNTIAAWIPVGHEPDGVAFDSRNAYVFVANTDGSNVSVIDDTTNKVIAWIAVGSRPGGVAFDESNGDVYVADEVSGSISVITSPTASSYPVTFSQSSLPTGTSWSISSGGTTRASKGGSIEFAARNGTFDFSVGFVFAFQPSPLAGSLTVAGAPVTQPIAFIALPRYTVTFTETGLPAGATWSVSMTYVGTQGSQGGTIAFQMPNGTYSFTAAAPGYVATPPSGSVIVAGLAVDEPIAIIVPPPPPARTYDVTFTEFGLSMGTTWSVTLGSSTHTSPVDFMVFVEPNGTYPFAIGGVSGYDETPSTGMLTVAGKQAAVSVFFVGGPTPTYSVTFTETGLPGGTSWSVSLGGSTHTSPSVFMTFAEPNGTYSFTVAPVAGYVAAAQSGSITVAGRALIESLVFTPTSGPPSDEQGFSLFGLSAWASYVVVAAALALGLVTTITFVALHRRRSRPPTPPRRDP